MITIVLDKLVKLFGFWKEDSDEVWKELVSIYTDLSEKYSKPFKRELLNNLISKENADGKREVIKYYLIILKDAIYIPEEFRGLIPVVSDDITISENGFEKMEILDLDNKPVTLYIGRTLKANPEIDSFFYYMGQARHYTLWDLLLEEMYILCNHFKISFRMICSEINFPEESLLFLKFLENEMTESKDHALKVPPESDEELSSSETAPVFTSQFIPVIFDILKEFFTGSNHSEFLRILQTGKDAKKPLLFKDSGKRLTDAFKQLYNAGIIIGCQKKELESWICKNFQYRYRGAVKTFTRKYVADVISSKDDNCARPIFNVIQDKATGQCLIRKV